MKEIVRFKKQRELGTILSDIFKFIRLNWKMLFGLILKISGPALLVLLITYIFYAQSIMGSLGMLESLGTFSSFSSTSLFSLLLLFLAVLVYYSLLNGVIMHFIKSYIKNEGTVLKEEVTRGVKEDFWKLIGVSFLVGIITFFGLMICVIPGIYLGVVLSTAYAIVVFDKKEVMDSISYCFNLIKNEWWITFATFFVVFLLYYFIMIIFQMPQYIYFFIKGFTMSQQITADPSSMFDWVYVTLTAIAMLFQYLLYTIIVICSAFVYFNLNEKKNFTGTLEAIDSLGKTE